MGLLLNIHQEATFFNILSNHDCPKFQLYSSCSFIPKRFQFLKYQRVQSALQGNCGVVNHTGNENLLKYKAPDCNGGELDSFPCVQTLREFPIDELFGKVVLVRFDSTILLPDNIDQNVQSASNALHTIKYLHEAGAKLILVSGWRIKNDLKLFTGEYVADFLSSALHYKVLPVRWISSCGLTQREALEKSDIILSENIYEFKGEAANCSEFAEALASGVEIFVNDSFSQAHRVLASTVGVTRFCYACLAGFHFEQSLSQLKKAVETSIKPYVAIVAGGNLLDKSAALHFLASICDGLVFVGMMSFQIMHALGLIIPPYLVEHGALKEAFNIVQFARSRNVQILCPKDFWCKNDCFPGKLEIFPADGILNGWIPFDIGPLSFDEINCLLSKCKKTIWIGPVQFHKSDSKTEASKLVQVLDQLSQRSCNITVIGNMACKAVASESSSISVFNMIFNASVVWEFLKGRKLPAVIALDRAYPFEIDWNDIFTNPTQPLVVDIGSGNGHFLLGMANKRKDWNFLGLEINEKLVSCCLHSIRRLNIRNVYFIATNATSTFRSLVCSYPGKLVLVSVQCPNPDFNKPEHRWRMLQRLLVEAVTDLLVCKGKVFLQSDIEEVAVRMKEEFLKYGKGKLLLHEGDDEYNQGWLKENPFGVRSDWEQHVLNRGAPMYRLMLSKSTSTK